jgi:hypothetical protein
VKANANGSAFGVGDLAGGASIKNDVLQKVWFALPRNTTPLFYIFNTPCCRELTRGVFVQSVRGTRQISKKVQVANSLSNDNASFARAQYDGAN